MARPFMETLRELRAGRTLEELGDQLAELVAAVKATGKSGEIRLTLKICPPAKGSISYLTIRDDVRVKMPVMDRGDTVFFPTADGGLSRNDPAQLDLKLRPVPVGVDPETGEVIQMEGGQHG